MITEDYVSFETAKLLKDKGFNEETAYAYSNNGELLRLNHFGIKDLTNTDCNGYDTWQFPIEGVTSIISAPTLQMATKWLREVHGIYIDMRITNHSFSGLFDLIKYYWVIEDAKIARWKDESTIYKPSGFDKYEEAYDNAIKHYLEKYVNLQ